MATAAFVLVPLLVLSAAWFLLNAMDGGGRRPLAVGLGFLVAAAVLTAVGIALDDPSPTPSRHGTTAGDV